MNRPPCPLCLSQDTRALLNVDRRAYFLCPECGARFLDPDQHPTRADERREYEQHRNEPDDPAYRRFLNTLLEPLLPKLSPGAEGLDYGCGPGPALAAMFEERGHPMQLYDPLFFGDDSPLQRRYDFITCTEAAEHFHRPNLEFRRLDTLLRPGGWLGVMTRFQTDDARFARWHYRRDPTHVVFYRQDTMRWIAQRYDWTLELLPPSVALFHKARDADKDRRESRS
jgi:SAM-dependent methyltransferase